MLREIIKTSGGTRNTFFLKGNEPGLEIDSGMHGDEKGIIDPLVAVLAEHLPQLPSLLFIPRISPSAVELGTRTNVRGIDMNRNFSDESQDPEVRLIMEALKDHRFKKAVSFHEDPEYFYVYDAGDANLENTEALEKMRREIESLGVELLDGVDDEGDSALGNLISRGYRYFLPETQTDSGGFFGAWALSKGITQRALTVEVPAKLIPADKKRVVDIVFRHLIE